MGSVSYCFMPRHKEERLRDYEGMFRVTLSYLNSPKKVARKDKGSKLIETPMSSQDTKSSTQFDKGDMTEEVHSTMVNVLKS